MENYTRESIGLPSTTTPPKGRSRIRKSGSENPRSETNPTCADGNMRSAKHGGLRFLLSVIHVYTSSHPSVHPSMCLSYLAATDATLPKTPNLQILHTLDPPRENMPTPVAHRFSSAHAGPTVFPPQSGMTTPFFNTRFTSISPHLSSQPSPGVS